MTRYTKTFAEALKEVREPKALDESTKLAQLVGKSIAHLEMYVELANDVKKIPIGDITSWLKSKAEQASKNVPLVIKELRRPNIWNEQVEELEEHDCTKVHPNKTHKEWLLSQAPVGEELEELEEKDGANTSTKKGSVWRAAMKARMKKNYMKKAENDPSIKEADEKGETDIDKIALAKEKDTDAIEKQLQAALSNLALTKQKLENEKNKVVKPQPNKDTGEVPLRTGLANAILDKKINTKSLVQAKKKEEIKVGGKTKVEINPEADIGNFSGGMRTNPGNLH